MKKVIVISTSLRRGSNSDMLADKFVEGAIVAGNDEDAHRPHERNVSAGLQVP